MNEHRKYHEGVVSDDPIARTICEVCGRKLSNNASLAKHRRLHETEKESLLLKCKICERGFRRESSLNRHVSAHLNPNYFECEECKLPLPSAASLQRHRLSHQGSSSTFDCKVCKVSFLTKDRLNAHQTHTGHQQDRKRFECNVCHERFFVGREFSRHIKLHPKYKMSECTLCGKRLSTVQSLMLHLSRHFESNSILCPHCGKQFFEANHLKVHIRTHTGEKPYTCPHCSKGFVTRTRCKQHINLIHQGIGCDLIQSSISKKVAVFEAFEAPS
ncbi:UNVERIFIED_CONTAM: hypothetical protein PYX00_003952 [Menopon gallinae]|uniref:C2H2-type domain-containing protein n=1 Tax=Menopon gallinae TaxID=328185 RepID=A0AAW2I2W5_9NEOP